MRYFVMVFAALALLACSGERDTERVEPERVASAEVGAGDVSNIVAHAEFPGGVVLTTEYHVRTDERVVTKKGAIRQRVVLELLEAEPDQASALVSADLERAGYKRVRQKDERDGSHTIVFKKPKAKTLSVRFYRSVARRPAHPEAKSMVAFSWQVEAAPKKDGNER